MGDRYERERKVTAATKRSWIRLKQRWRILILHFWYLVCFYLSLFSFYKTQLCRIGSTTETAGFAYSYFHMEDFFIHHHVTVFSLLLICLDNNAASIDKSNGDQVIMWQKVSSDDASVCLPKVMTNQSFKECRLRRPLNWINHYIHIGYIDIAWCFWGKRGEKNVSVY